MNNLIEPNLHPLIVHFVIAFLLTSAIAYAAIQFAPRQSEWRVSLKSAADWMLGLGVIAAVAAVGAGLQAYYSVAHDGPSHEAMTFHRNIAIPTAGVFVLLGLWRWAARKNFPSLVFSLAMLLASAALATTAWWGGKLVYGYGLGVASLPQATGEGHDHEQAPGQGHGDETETASAEGQDDGHDHGDADDHSAGDHDHDETAAAEPGTGGAEPAAAFDADNYPETPKAVVEAYGAALKAKDEAAIRGMLSPDVIIAEGGGAERSVEEYAGHHMPADMEFTAVVEFSVKKRDVIANDEIATVISESQVHGTFRGENVHSRMMETMVLRREDDRWRIVHIHWSSAPIAGEHEH